jgi:peptide/nickel transport system ATP-binding protein
MRQHLPPPPDTKTAVLDIRGLRIEFPDSPTHSAAHPATPAVDGLNLTIRHGEILALVGESGSGKTLTARSILQLLPPSARITAGQLILGDQDLTTLRPRQMNTIRGNRIAMLFQQPKTMLDPTATIRSQVAEPLRLHQKLSRRQAKARVVELLHDVGIPEPERRAAAYAHQLSGGMAQRVMFATALASEPELLIADEPTTALDATVQAQILQLIRRKQRASGMSVLLITHDLGVVASIADRVAVMYSGRIVEDGTVHDVFHSPEHPYTQALLRASLLDTEHGQLFSIPGNTTQSRALDHGCRFQPRCTLTEKLGITRQCASTEPTLHTCHNTNTNTSDSSSDSSSSTHHCRCWATPDPNHSPTQTVSA